MSSRTKANRDAARQNKKVMRQGERDILREQRALERRERELELEIKKMAKQGNQQAARMLAKQLINLRNTKTRNLAAINRIKAASTHATTMASSAAVAGAMEAASGTMAKMNEAMSPQKLSASMQAFQQESMKMDLASETMDDALEAAFDDDSELEEEAADVLQSTLDEIGLDVGSKLATPSSNRPIASKSEEKDTVDVSDEDALLKRLAALSP